MQTAQQMREDLNDTWAETVQYAQQRGLISVQATAQALHFQVQGQTQQAGEIEGEFEGVAV